MSANNYDLSKLGYSDLDTGEEGLLTEIKHVSFGSENEPVVFYCGVDCGSTQTRAVFVPKSYVTDESIGLEEWFKMRSVIPSIFKTVPDPGHAFKPASSKLYDSMDSTTSIGGEKYIRNIRGPLSLGLEVKRNELVSSEKKIVSDSLKYNIADVIGYGLFQTYVQKELPIPKMVYIYLSLALPADDLLSKDIDALRRSFKTISWALGKNDAISIVIRDLKVYPETEMQVVAHYGISGKEIPSEIILLEGGGRNAGSAVMVNGKVIPSGSKVLEQSGSQLLDMIGTRYMEEYGVKMPSTRHLSSAVKTGFMKYGNGARDITSIVKECKDLVAEDLFYKLQSQVISKQSVVSFDTLDEFLLAGRLFAPGNYDYSIANRIAELTKVMSPGTVVRTLEDNLIPEGCVLQYLMESEG